MKLTGKLLVGIRQMLNPTFSTEVLKNMLFVVEFTRLTLESLKNTSIQLIGDVKVLFLVWMTRFKEHI